MNLTVKKSAIMDKKFALVLASLTLAAFSAFACNPTPNASEANLGQEVTLAPGESISVSGEPLKIKFVEVISDSRCPTGVVCVWAGEASSMVEITYKGSVVNKVLIQPGSSEGSAIFDKYVFKFKVQPYPEAGKTINKQSYRLVISVNSA